MSTKDIQRRIRRYRQLDSGKSAWCIAREWVCLALLIGGAIWFAEAREGLGLPVESVAIVFAVVVVLVGAVQHRLAGLGHEAAHGSLFSNRRLNDLAGDFFCFYPLLATVQFYRLFHLAHHQFTNDPERDPDLVNLGRSKRVADYPMPRLRCILMTFFRWLCDPVSVARYQWDYFYLNTLGRGGNVYVRRMDEAEARRLGPDVGTVLGVLWVLGFLGVAIGLSRGGLTSWVPVAGLAAAGVGAAGVLASPEGWLHRSPLKHAFSTRAAGSIRLVFYLAVFAVIGCLWDRTSGRVGLYAFLLWILPMGTSFSYFMLLRDIYQHTNAEVGRLTNSRVFYADWFTRWSVFIYGQDIHLTHHLYPMIPHYHLPELHSYLQAVDPEYRQTVVECHGVLRGDGMHPTILDELTRRRVVG